MKAQDDGPRSFDKAQIIEELKTNGWTILALESDPINVGRVRFAASREGQQVMIFCNENELAKQLREMGLL